MQRFLRLVFAISLLSICKLLNAVGFYPYLFLKTERDTALSILTCGFTGGLIFKFNGRRWRRLVTNSQTTPAAANAKPVHAQLGRAFKISGCGVAAAIYWHKSIIQDHLQTDSDS